MVVVRLIVGVLILLMAIGCGSTTMAGTGGDTVATLPEPTGPCRVGRTSRHWVDPARAELETSDPDDVRELMVHVFYPADPGTDADPAI